jgi:hypothetical protein
VKKQKKIEKTKFDSFSIVVISVFLIIILSIIVFNTIKFKPNTLDIDITENISSDLVCMVNDSYVGKKQIEIVVNNKLYYGCCDKCESILKNDSTSRFFLDPFTGEKVDKAEAYIVLKSKGKRAVQYFKSRENFEKFIKTKIGTF